MLAETLQNIIQDKQKSDMPKEQIFVEILDKIYIDAIEQKHKYLEDSKVEAGGE